MVDDFNQRTFSFTLQTNKFEPISGFFFFNIDLQLDQAIGFLNGINAMEIFSKNQVGRKKSSRFV